MDKETGLEIIKYLYDQRDISNNGWISYNSIKEHFLQSVGDEERVLDSNLSSLTENKMMVRIIQGDQITYALTHFAVEGIESLKRQRGLNL